MSATVKALYVLTIGLAVLFGALPSRADARGGGADVRARELFEAGRAAFEEGRYRAAAIAFERSFELSGRAALLLNAGNAWDRLGDRVRAAAALRQYLAADPESPRRDAIEDRIAELEADRTAVASVPRDRPPSDTGWLLGRRWTWVALALSVAGAAVAAWSWSDATARYEALQQSCGPSGCSEDDIEGVRGPVAWTNAGLVTSLVALGGAVLLWFVEGGDLDEPRAVELRATGGGLELGGRF